MRRPDFIIAGTQKAGTTWLRQALYAHVGISGAQHQIHFFDRHYQKGLAWYCKHFDQTPPSVIAGEKTTEYFDTVTASHVAYRIAQDCPETKIIVLLRDPVARALSALAHMVTSGLEPLPKEPDAVLFLDRERSVDRSYRYIERGFYARQLEAFRRYIADDQLLVLIFEEDIVDNPRRGLQRALEFLGADAALATVTTGAVNNRRLSRSGIRLMRNFRRVPYARSLVWRIDTRLPLKRWRPEFSRETVNRLREIFEPENEALYRMLGRRISAWEDNQ